MKICLTMIVRNESHVIRRCIQSVLPLVDCICICDNGDNEDTALAFFDTLKEFGRFPIGPHIAPEDMLAQDIRVLYKHVPWVNFGFNRTQAFREAEAGLGLTSEDFHLVLDADDVLEYNSDPHFPDQRHFYYWTNLSTGLPLQGQTRMPIHLQRHLAYTLMVRHREYHHRRPHLFAADGGWEYRGRVHEAAHRIDGSNCVPAPLSHPVYHVVGGGARSLVEAKQKFLADATSCREDLRDDPENSRAAFYLAQSLRDGGEIRESIKAYLHRAKMGGWQQEVYISLLQAGRLYTLSDGYALNSEQNLLKAHLVDPARAEAAYELALLNIKALDVLKGTISEGSVALAAYSWAMIAANCPAPAAGALFPEPAIWEASRRLAEELRERIGLLCRE